MAIQKNKLQLDASQFLNSLEQALQATQKVEKALKDSLGGKISPSVDSSQIEAALSDINNLEQSLKSAGGNIDITSTVDDSDLDSFNQELSSFDGETINAFAEIDNSDVDVLNQELASADGQVINARAEVDDSDLDGLSDKAKEEGEEAGRAFSGSFSEIVKGSIVGGGVLGAIGLVANAGRAAFDSFQDLNTQVANIGTLGVENFEEFTDLATQASKEVPDSAANIAAGVYQSISAGIQGTNEEIVEFTQQASKVATAGLATTEEAVNGLTSVINAYGKEASDVNEVSDTFFAAIKLGKTSFNELNSGLANVIPAASAAGVQFDEVAANIAQITSLGVPTAQATTQLRQAIIELQKPGKDLAAVMGDVTVEIDGVQQTLNEQNIGKVLEQQGLTKTLQDIEQAASDSGKTLTQAFSSSEAASAALLLTGENAERATETLNNVRKEIEGGVSTEAYEKASQSIESQLSLLQNNLQAGFNELLSGLLPVINELLTTLTPIIGSLSSEIGGILSSITPVLLPLVKQVFEALQPVIKLITGTFLPIVIELIEFLSPLIADILGLLAPLSNLLIKALKPIQDLLPQILPSLTKLVKIVVEIADILLTALSPILEVVLEIFAELAGEVLSLLLPLLVDIASALKPLATALALILEPLTPLIRLIGQLLGFVVSLIADGLKPLTGVLGDVTILIGKLFEGLGKVVTEVAKFLGLLEDEEPQAPLRKTTDAIKNLNKETDKVAPIPPVIIPEDKKQIDEAGKSTNKLGGEVDKTAKKVKDLSNVFENGFKKALDESFNSEPIELKFKLPTREKLDVDRLADDLFDGVAVTKELKEAITGVTFEQKQLNAIDSAIDKLEKANQEITNLNLLETPQFFKALSSGQEEFIKGLSSISSETDNVLKDLESQKSGLQAAFLGAESDAEKEKILKQINDINTQIIDRTIETANVTNEDRKKLEQSYLLFKERNEKKATKVVKAEFDEQVKANNEQINTLKGKRKELVSNEEDLLDEQARLREELQDKELSEQERQQKEELKALADSFAEKLALARGNQQLYNDLIADFNQQRQEIIARGQLTFLEGLSGDISRIFQEGISSFDVSELINNNNEVDKSLKELEDTYKNDADALREQLKNKEISQEEYYENLRDLETEYNEQTKELNEQRISFFDVFGDAVASTLKNVSELFKSTFDSLAEDLVTFKGTTEEQTELIGDALTAVGASVAGELGAALAQGELTFGKFIVSIIDGVQAAITALLAQLIMQKEIQTFIPGVGTAGALAIYGVATGLLQAAKGLIGGAEEGVVGLSDSNKGKPGRTDTIPMMLAPGEAVINAKDTQKNKGILQAINEGKGWQDFAVKNIDPKLLTNNYQVKLGEKESVSMKGVETRLDRLEGAVRGQTKRIKADVRQVGKTTNKVNVNIKGVNYR